MTDPLDFLFLLAYILLYRNYGVCHTSVKYDFSEKFEKFPIENSFQSFFSFEPQKLAILIEYNIKKKYLMWIEPLPIRNQDRVHWTSLEEDEDKPFFVIEHYDPPLSESLELAFNQGACLF